LLHISFSILYQQNITLKSIVVQKFLYQQNPVLDKSVEQKRRFIEYLGLLFEPKENSLSFGTISPNTLSRSLTHTAAEANVTPSGDSTWHDTPTQSRKMGVKYQLKT